MTQSTIHVEPAVDDAVVSEPAPRTRPTVLSRLTDYGVVISCLVMLVVLSLASDRFLTTTNFLNILDQQSGLLIIGAGVTFVIIAGGFDLSVGATFALCGVIAAEVAIKTSPTVGLIVGPLCGLAIGTANGLLVTVGRINSFIATLATSMIISGAALAVTGGFLVTVDDPAFERLGRGELGGIKYSIILAAIVIAIFSFTLAKSTFGRYVYASGGNREAATFSGIRVNLIRIVTFALAGLCAGIASMISVSRVATAQADTGAGLELIAIAAVVLGGTSILGGEGAVWRTVLGVLLLAMIGNGFTLLKFDPVYQQIFRGTLIVAAVAVDAWARRGRRAT